MKRILIVLAVWTAFATNGQTTNNQPAPKEKEKEIETRLVERARETPPILKEEQPNEIERGKITYSGIAVAVIKTDNLLQLVNPAAPARQGSSEANLIRDPITRKASGLKIFSIEF